MNKDDNSLSIYQIEQIKAISAFLCKNPDFIYRKICRWYSRSFNTPLKEALKEPITFILQHYYESLLENKTYNEVFDIAVSDYLPEFVDEKEKEDQAFVEALEREQEKQLKAKKESKVSQSLNNNPTDSSNDIKSDKEKPIKNLNLTFEDERIDDN